MNTLLSKEEKLLAYLRSLDKFAVAFSGGVDSSLLVAACVKAGVQPVVLMAHTPMVPQFEKDDALRLTTQLKVPLQIITLDMLTVADFCKNGADRCYICKKMLFTQLIHTAQDLGCRLILDGANVDDMGDYRPGMQATRELHVQSPLLACGFTKADVRALASKYGLFVATKPSYACLASRVAYKEPITYAKLRQIEQAEMALQQLGFTDVRVRCHGNIARLEVNADQLQQALDLRAQIIAKVKQAGFSYVALDLEGFRSGSMNTELNK